MLDSSAGSLMLGVRTAAEACRASYGPRRGAVLVSQEGQVRVVTDGATILRHLHPEDAGENLGVWLSRDLAYALEKEVGDGTKTSVILLDAMAREWRRSGIPRDEAARICTSLIPRVSGLISSESLVPSMGTLRSLSRFYAGEETLGDSITEAFLSVSNGGAVLAIPGKHTGDRVSGDGSSAFHSTMVFPRDVEGEEQGPMYVVCNHHVQDLEWAVRVMEESTQWSRPLVVVARGFSRQVVDLAIANRERVTCLLVVMQSEADMADLASLVGATVTVGEHHWENDWFGSSLSCFFTRRKLLLVPYPETRFVESRGRQLALLQRAKPGETPWEAQERARRSARLRGEVCTLEVGGRTVPEAQVRRTTAERAMVSFRLATEGVVPSTPSVLYRVSREVVGGFLASAMREPLLCMSRRTAGEVGEGFPGGAWDVALGKWVGAREACLLDPTARAVAVATKTMSAFSTLVRVGAIVKRP